MPARQRPCGGCFKRSRPSKRMLPAVGVRPPAIRLNSVVLPAPFGPVMPTASPGPTTRSRSSATMIEPKLFFRPATSSMRCQRAARSGDGLHLAADGNRRRRLVVGYDDIVFAVLEPPLAADKGRLGDFLGREGG